MVIHFWIPKGNQRFEGFISSLQDKQQDQYIEIQESAVYRDPYLTYKAEFAFNYSSYFPAAVNVDSKNVSWISFSLKSDKSFFITHYQLLQRTDTGVNDCLVNFTFEGSNDQQNWIPLSVQHISNEDSFSKPKGSKLFQSRKGNFKHFRLRKHLRNDGTAHLLVIQKIEIYGYLCNNTEECNLQSLYRNTCQIHKVRYNLFIYLSIFCCFFQS